MGCIFAEILERKVLFQGRDHIDQLHKILGVLGLPRDVSFWDPSESVLMHIQSLCTTDGLPPPTEPVDFYALFPSCPPEGIVMLKGLLQLNPMKRLDVREALRSSFIQTFTDPVEESLVPPSCLPNQYDFERMNDDAELKNAVIHEIESFKHQQEEWQLEQQGRHLELSPPTMSRRHNTTAADSDSYYTTPTQKLNQLPSATMSLLEHSKTIASNVKGSVYTQDALVGEPEELGDDDNYSYLYKLINSTPGVPMESHRKFREPKKGVARDTLERALTGTW